MKLRNPFKAVLNRLSVFAKCSLLIAVSTLVVTVFLTWENQKILGEAVNSGVNTLAEGVTATVAARSGGAIRFGDAERLETDLNSLIEMSNGRAVHGLAINSKGKTVASTGTGTESEITELTAVAQKAMESGQMEFSENGYFVAAPAAAGAAGTVIVGAVGMSWSPDVALAEVAPSQIRAFILAAGAFIVMLTLSVFALRSMMSRPLSDVGQAINHLAEGDYDHPTGYQNRGDEIGQIARQTEALKTQLAAARAVEAERQLAQEVQKKVVERLNQGLAQLADGDLSRTIDEAFSEDYESLRQNFNNTVEKMVGIIDAVIESTDRIRASSEEISQSSGDLSSRTESQAATLEETAAAMEELTVSVRSAADGAREVEGIVSEAKDTAINSGEVVTRAVDAMSKIEKSSEKISQIISVIDDISFQTNLLALNAGVEAARAGEAGRGFAVVASEVRALAQRSSDAAQEIKQLITESTSHVGDGVDLVGRAGQELQQIIERVATISGHVSGIATGAQEQSTTLAEINTGVTQLDQVTQHNAAMVEESTAASQILRNDANELAQQVSVFRTRKSAGNVVSMAAAPAPARAVAASPAPSAHGDDFFDAEPSSAAVGWEDF
ncbi:HAMP domain-containing protein [Rhodobacteraceae bacterium R_SAG1]|jgi:methyl-accepting chemotaxis protein|uniref:methyl-accepting chemotaxis protein n=1 Tax=Phaeobacter italicus TaxID=481446 RepID=UPI001444D3B2|nr:methyl-accepting chemotaxis protein [Phaeobacter italicus]MBO9443995.1 HAMP domain-containing protein [Phaeobacter italicus]MBY6045272.1 HAMP domain-containing protein [Phaeobacter italicus]NKX40510.1 HAMP domain-containing protein [Rhodobacteraceae bacterium R_SAG2]NKX71289.1 HAMP domain-containing protein [Rhodobacteraceae bacterium R_SAG1]